MSSKAVVSFADAQEQLFDGLQSTARVVSLAYGPSGRNVVVQRDYGGKISRDGVSLTRVLELENSLPQIGVKLLRNVAVEMSDVAGDGTSLAVLLSVEMMLAGLKARASELPVNDIRAGIDLAVQAVDQHLLETSMKASDSLLLRVGETASGGDTEISSLICKSLLSSDDDSHISVELGDGIETEVITSSGINLDTGYVSHKFVSEGKEAACSLEQPLILVTDIELDGLDPLIPILDQVVDANRELCVICSDISGDALSTLILNNQSDALKSVAIRVPGSGPKQEESLADIAMLTGAKFISKAKDNQLREVELDDLGTAKLVEVASQHTLIKGGADQELLNKRMIELRARRDSDISEFEREEVAKKLSWLQGKSTSIRVGGLSKDEIKERRDRAVNCIQSVKAAQLNGVIIGGGISLLQSSLVLDSIIPENQGQRAGIELVAEALVKPVRQIAENQGLENGYVASKLLHSNFDIESSAKLPVDPLSTIRLALAKAASVSKTLISSEYAIFSK